jgi:2-keto-4-pentenoate hydratase/2-oxohepta-3-ene-1,7-dioic acid hydratase in catechol pathway
MHLVTFERRDAGIADGDPLARTPASSIGESLGFDTLDAGPPGVRRVGAVLPEGPHAGSIVDLNRALAIKLACEDVGAPEAEADSLLPAEMQALLRAGRRSRGAAREALEFTTRALEGFDGPDMKRAGVVIARDRVRLCAPVPRPGKIVGVAWNYAAHAAEQDIAAHPVEPVLFLKAPTAVIGPEDEIAMPAATSQVDYEGELAVVMGKAAARISSVEALDFVAGYCVANDVTARDFQNVRGQKFIGKSCDTFAPLGPALVTADEVPDPQKLALRTLVSGETLQSASTEEMLFSVAEIIAFASRIMTLEPGDVILSGTPSGVGQAQRPRRWLRDGDVVEVEIAGLGHLRNPVRSGL